MRKKPTLEELKRACCELRAYSLTCIHAAGSGHPGGSLSIIEVAAALFLHEANLDPKNPKADTRDRIFFSTGHKAPVLYLALARAGFFSPDEVVTLRKLNSPFQGHPNAPRLPGVEISSGSLGQGLSVACGCALAGKLDKKDYRVYCIMGDGEQQEGSVWEAAMAAGHYRLDNLVGIVDRNKLQIDGVVDEVMGIDPLAERYRAFGWHAIEIDGHDLESILAAFAEARKTKGKPTIIIADTIKGKGVSFMENTPGWHGIATRTDEEYERAMKDVGCPAFDREKIKRLQEKAKAFQQEQDEKLRTALPSFSHEYWWNRTENMKVKMDATRSGFGRGVARAGEDPRVVTIHADISDSIRITDFEKADPRRKERVFSVGIAEQNMMGVAAGLALEGKIPVTGTYGVFASGRPWDQIRTSICYDNLNVKIGGAHGGVSVGADGATHQALEEIALMTILPNMRVGIPCDSIETEKMTRTMILEVNGPAYIRFAREATPVVTCADTPFRFGTANVIRLRKTAENFADAFETRLDSEYKNENEDLTLIACGPMVPEAMRAAWILKEEYGLETRVLNVHTVKPIDREALSRAAWETGIVITCEEHQVGGFGNIVAGVIAEEKDYQTPLLFSMIGVPDIFGQSGGPWELMQVFGLAAEFIAVKAKRLHERKRT